MKMMRHGEDKKLDYNHVVTIGGPQNPVAAHSRAVVLAQHCHLQVR